MPKSKIKLSLLSLFFLSSLSCNALELTSSSQNIRIDPQTLAISWQIKDEDYIVNEASINYLASQIIHNDSNEVKWYWEKEKINVTARLSNGDLKLTFKAQEPFMLNWFNAPEKNISEMIIPFKEGFRIPTQDKKWVDYLTNNMGDSNTTQDLSMPFWSQKTTSTTHQKDIYVSWMMLNPYNNNLHFSSSQNETLLDLSATHEFTLLNNKDEFSVLIHLGNNILSGAQRYKKYQIEKGMSTSLSEKIQKTPQAKKMIGASQVYLFGDGLLNQSSIKDWWGLRDILLRNNHPLAAFFDKDAKKELSDLTKGKDFFSSYYKGLFIQSLNQAINLYIPIETNPNDPNFIQAHYDAAQKRKAYLTKEFNAYLQPESSWGQGISEEKIQLLSHMGLTKLWLGLDKWMAAFYQTKAVNTAKQQGYIVGAYDSYDTAIEPNINDDWLAAQMPDQIRKDCAIITKSGVPKKGFKGNGYYLNPACGKEYMQYRTEKIIQLSQIDSLFLDVDATAMLREDYAPSRLMNQKQMGVAFNERLKWVADHQPVILGSEDGNALTSQSIIFAHGMESMGFGWQDAEMHQKRNSPYFLGIWYPDNRPDFFFKSAQVKQPYQYLFFSPQFALPLYQSVFHDQLISSAHWHTDQLKFSNVQAYRDINMMLYNTAPMVHLSHLDIRPKSQRIKALKHYQSAYLPIHEKLWDKALEKFEYLSKDYKIQQTTFSDGSFIIANFDKKERQYEQYTLPALSITAELKGNIKIQWQSLNIPK